MNDRIGRCYELAWDMATEDPEVVVVHGSIEGMGNPRIPHAWVRLPSGEIYDPVLDEAFPPVVHERFFSAEVAVEYSAEAAVLAGAISGHKGPWHEAPFGNAWYEEVRKCASTPIKETP